MIHNQRQRHLTGERYATLVEPYTHLRQNFRNLSKVATPPLAAASEKVFNDAGSNRKAHLVELLVDLAVVFIVLYELDDESSIGEREQLGVLRASQASQ